MLHFAAEPEPRGAYQSTLTGHLAGLAPAARNAATASIAGAHGVAARMPGPAGRWLTQAANTAYVHGIAHAAAVSTGLLVICAVLCATLLPAPQARRSSRENTAK
jgi:hypothetical protein